MGDIVERLGELLAKMTPPGQWQAGRSDVTWYNAAGEQQANIYHATEADGLHIGQPLPLTIATFGTGRLNLADPQAHAKLTVAAINALPDLLDELTRLRTRTAALEEALTPSGDTKAAYIGEFSFRVPLVNEVGDEYTHPFHVPWTTIKEIMAAIRARAALKEPT